eukprot:3444105-Amphidinium_carterae.1
MRYVISVGLESTIAEYLGQMELVEPQLHAFEAFGPTQVVRLGVTGAVCLSAYEAPNTLNPTLLKLVDQRI